MHYNPEPLPESVISGRPELRGQNLDKFYPAFMEGGPFDGRELSIEYEPPHPRMPFGKLPFISATPGAPSYHYDLVPDRSCCQAVATTDRVSLHIRWL